MVYHQSTVVVDRGAPNNIEFLGPGGGGSYEAQSIATGMMHAPPAFSETDTVKIEIHGGEQQEWSAHDTTPRTRGVF